MVHCSNVCSVLCKSQAVQTWVNVRVSFFTLTRLDEWLLAYIDGILTWCGRLETRSRADFNPQYLLHCWELVWVAWLIRWDLDMITSCDPSPSVVCGQLSGWGLVTGVCSYASLPPPTLVKPRSLVSCYGQCPGNSLLPDSTVFTYIGSIT